MVKTTGSDSRLGPTRFTATTVTQYIWLGRRLVSSNWVVPASTVVELSSPVSTRTQVMLYWIKGKMEKGGSHETIAAREVMLSTMGLGERGTPVSKGGKEEGGVYIADMYASLLVFLLNLEHVLAVESREWLILSYFSCVFQCLTCISLK